MIPKGDWVYALECILFPVLWGLVMVRVTERIEKILTRPQPESNHSTSQGEGSGACPLSPEYHI